MNLLNVTKSQVTKSRFKFVGKDVAKALGYSNTRKALQDHVDEEDKRDGVTIRDSIGRIQKAVFINESGLYSLILSSKLPQAKAFKHRQTMIDLAYAMTIVENGVAVDKEVIAQGYALAEGSERGVREE